MGGSSNEVRRFPPIIAISGKQRSGKDAFADRLLTHFPLLEKRPFSLAIKQSLAADLGISVETIEADKATYRPELIRLGEAARAENEDVWIHRTFGYPLQEGKVGAVVPDLRLPRELEALQYYQALLIRVEASEEHRAARGALVMAGDKTEIALDGVAPWPIALRNEGSEADFFSLIDSIVVPVVARYLEN